MPTPRQKDLPASPFTHENFPNPASKIILPSIAKRKDTDFVRARRASAPTAGVPPDYMLDFAHAHDLLSTHCPEIDLHASLGDLHDVPSLLTPVDVDIADDDLNGALVLDKPSEWELALWSEIDASSPSASRHYPLRVRLTNTTTHFPVYKDGAETAREFGSLIRASPDARRLAGSALFTLAQRFGVDISPRSDTPRKDGFIGVHLRVEKDSGDDFPDYTSQAGAAIEHVTRTDAKVVFLATGGSGGQVQSFKERAADFGMTVVTKADLLEGDDAMDLWRMTYDQKALVDYEIMKRAGQMVGQSWSKFSWDLAIARGAAYGKAPAHKVPVPSGMLSWQDDFTTLIGTMKANRGATIHATWP